MTRTTLVRFAAAALLVAGVAAVTLYQFGGRAVAGEVTVWKSPACGCCVKNGWSTCAPAASAWWGTTATS